MAVRALLAAAVLLAAASDQARAGLDGCAVVLPTPDGFLSLRAGPGARFGEKARLRAGDHLWVTDTTCLRQGARTICDSKRRWFHVSSVRRLDRGRDITTEGWVYARHLKPVECRDDS
jgi:hypothetical protein